MKGKVKTLKFSDLSGYNTDMAVYPVTSVLGVFDENNTDLKTIIANLQKAIEKKADGSSVSTANFIPVIISIDNSTNPGTPSGGSYNYSTRTLTPPSGGWVVGGTISTTTYISVGVVNSETGAITWSTPFNSMSAKGGSSDTPTLRIGTTTTLDSGSNATVSMTNNNNVYTINFGIPKGAKGDKGDSGSGSGTIVETDEVSICYAYIHADSLPSKPTGGAYNASDKSFNVIPDTWKTSASGLEKPIYMSMGIGHSKDGSIDWQDPFLVFSNTSDLPFDEVPQSNYATTFCYKRSNETLLTAPVGGVYDFDSGKLTTPPDGWAIDKSSLLAPFYMSIGSVKRDENGNVTIKWSVPIYLTSKDSLSQGETPGTDNLVQAHVVIAYQNADATPSTPAATEGSVDFTTDPYTVTAPTGWFITADDTHKITDDTWCTIKAFYYKKDSDGNNAYAADNNTRVWSAPVKSSEAKVSLTKEELDLVVGKMSITANEISTAVSNYVLDASYIETVAKEINTKTDIATTVAGKITFQTEDWTTIADNVITVCGGSTTVVQNAAGEIVSAIQADKDGLLSLVAQKLVLEATKTKDDDDGFIMLVAKNAVNDVAAQLMVGTDSTTGKGYIKLIADNIDISGQLKTKDIEINNGSTYFASDGSGYVANKNIKWDTEGNLAIKGDGVIGDIISDITLSEDNNYGSFTTYGDKNTVKLDAAGGYSLYNITNTRTTTVTDSTAALLTIGYVFIEGHKLGRRIKLVVTNTADTGSILIGSGEGANFIFTDKAGSKFTTVSTETAGSFKGIRLCDGYYELVGIGEKKWLLSVGYASSTIS